MKNIIQNANLKFWESVNKYDTNNPNILRKIIHSFTVANTCFDISCRFGFNERDRNFCYILGLFHDIGRFEQWKTYETYDDNKSKNHGDIGEVEFLKINPESLFLTKQEFKLMSLVIKFHSQKYCGNDKKLIKMLEVIHNADAYANVITTANGCQQLFTTSEGYTQEILDKFYAGERLYSYSTPTKLDRLLKLSSGVNNVEIDFLRKDIIERNYIDIIYNVYSDVLIAKEKKIFKDAIEHLKKNYKENL